jgi:hypothetical protein
MSALHDCPGGCGAKVERHLFACRGCWARLPIELRRWITGAYRRRAHGDHIRAMAEAVRFYQADAS